MRGLCLRVVAGAALVLVLACHPSKTPLVEPGGSGSSGGAGSSAVVTSSVGSSSVGSGLGTSAASNVSAPASAASGVVTHSSGEAPGSSAEGGSGSMAASESTSVGTSAASGLPGNTCETAEPVDGQELISGLTTVGFTHKYDVTGDTCFGAAGQPERVHRVDVAAGNRLDVDVIPATGFDVAANLVLGPASNCGGPGYQCVSFRDIGNAGETENLTWANTGTSAQTVFIVVMGSVDQTPVAGGGYALRVHQSPVAPGDACGNAVLVAPGIVTGQSMSGFTNQFHGNRGAAQVCKAFPAPDRFYGVDVPSGQRLTVTVTPDSTFDATLSLLVGMENCASPNRVCVAGVDQGNSGDPETANYTNDTAQTQQVFVAVDCYFTPPVGNFTLNVVVQTPQPGESCALPVELPLGASTGTTVGFVGDVTPQSGCTGGLAATGADKVYAAVVPPGKKLSVAVQSTDAAFDPALYILLGPAAQCQTNPLPCLTGSDVSGLAENVTYVNPGAQPQPVFVVVDSTKVTPGAFSMTATLGDP